MEDKSRLERNHKRVEASGDGFGSWKKRVPAPHTPVQFIPCVIVAERARIRLRKRCRRGQHVRFWTTSS